MKYPFEYRNTEQIILNHNLKGHFCEEMKIINLFLIYSKYIIGRMLSSLII